ncbi:MAG: ABC transporter ATP-binding protein [Vibrio sp.]
MGDKPMQDIVLDAAELTYAGDSEPVFCDLNARFNQGQWSVLVGRSGCGKTSLLRYLAGLLSDEEVTWAANSTINTLDVAYMAQQDLLLPWLSVLENVCLSGRFSPQKTDLKERALALLSEVDLLAAKDLLPSQLSGGMRQRVALARTLIQDKPVVLMDEPFSALDAVTRYQLQNLAAKLLKNKTVVLITHDPQEAYRLGHRVYLMQGKPAKAIELAVKDSDIPRPIDADLAQFQQQMLSQLEKQS